MVQWKEKDRQVSSRSTTIAQVELLRALTGLFITAEELLCALIFDSRKDTASIKITEVTICARLLEQLVQFTQMIRLRLVQQRNTLTFNFH